MSDPAERFLEDHADGHGVGDYAAAADALVAAELIQVGRAECWKAEHTRLRATANAHLGPHDERLAAKAVELLESLFAPVRPRASDDWDPATYRRYQEALFTLTGIGALSQARARPWLERQHRTLTPPGGRPEPEPDPELPFAAGELHGVLAGPADRLDGMRVTSLELYADCVIVRFHQLLPPEPEDPVARRELLRATFGLQDDRGTRYEAVACPPPRGCRPRKLDRWPDLLVGWQAFVPGAPVAARDFTVAWRDGRFRLSREAPAG